MSKDPSAEDLLRKIKDEHRSLQELAGTVPAASHDRRALFAKSELLLMDVEKLVAKADDGAMKTELDAIAKDLASISDRMALGFAQRGSSPLLLVDEAIRLAVAWSFLALASVFLALPCLLFYPVDVFLLRRGILSPHTQINCLCRKFIASFMMKLSGANIVIQGLDHNAFGRECGIVCFSHSSTMDAFLISATIPVRALTMGKSELFLIPFFSWCLMAFGGVPIDRNNRGQAIEALERAAASATGGQCVAIAPEGTRSKSGHIGPFKKGTFYLWEQLQTPIIPLVIYGAFDLFPPGKNICLTGKVYVRFLDPILPNEASSREEMGQLVRRRMLAAWADGPRDAAAQLTWQERLEHWICLLSFLFVVIAVLAKFPVSALLAACNLTAAQGVLVFIAVSIVITLFFYVQLMYVSRWVKAPKIDRRTA